MRPLQPIKDGRFERNEIVRYLLDNGGIDMNKLACLEFSVEDREQFAQLIGYSLDGFSTLSYVRDETYYAAEKINNSNGELDEQTAKILAMEEVLTETRKKVKDIQKVCKHQIEEICYQITRDLGD